MVDGWVGNLRQWFPGILVFFVSFIMYLPGTTHSPNSNLFGPFFNFYCFKTMVSRPIDLSVNKYVLINSIHLPRFEHH